MPALYGTNPRNIALHKPGGFWGEEISNGAKLIADFVGSRTSRNPYYYLNGVSYYSISDLPGWMFSGGTTTNSANRYAEDASGNLVAFASGLPRITNRGFLVEEARTNLLTYSAVLSTNWLGARATAVPASAIAPNGILEAIKVLETTANNSHTWYQGIVVASGTYGLSFFVKAAERTKAHVTFAGNSGSSAFFDLTGAGSVIGGGLASGASIVALGNGWYRCSVVAPVTGAQNVGVGPLDDTGAFSYTGDASKGIYAWGGQLELGSFPTSPIVTTSAAATRAADNASVTGLSGILGQFRTNLLTYSAVFENNTAWNNANVTVTADAVVAPDGTLKADQISQTAVTTSFSISQSIGTATVGKTYTGSVYAKMGTHRYVQLTFSSAGFGAAQFANVDLLTGAVGTVGGGATVTVTDAGNGWWRLTYTATATALATPPFFIFQVTSNTSARAESFTGNISNYIYLWGAQAETGPVATSYIPTTAAAASAGNPVTLVAWADLPAADGVNRNLATVDDGTTANRFDLRRTSDNKLGSLVVSGGVTQAAVVTTGLFTGARTVKGASRLWSTTVALAVDGASVGSASVTAPSNLSRVLLGSAPVNANYLNGYIQRIQILGDTSDTILQKLSYK